MTRADRDLVAALRAELSAIDPGRPCDRAAESHGLGMALSTREAAVARLAVRLGRGTDARHLLATRTAPGARPKHLRANDAVGANPDHSALESALKSGPRFDWAASADHCRLAYLRGRFLSRGSLSLANGRTHLEFVVEPAEAPILASWLAEIDLPASWRLRRGRGVVTWKSADIVETFLRRIGAGGALLELEARRVSRAMRGDLNRVINAESANLHRIVGAAGRQLAAIESLDRDGVLAQQPHLVRMVAAARRETPEATFTEIGERLGVHRSAVQRALKRVESLALHPAADERHFAGRRFAGRRAARALPRALRGRPALA
jgi:cell division protein WhiA